MFDRPLARKTLPDQPPWNFVYQGNPILMSHKVSSSKQTNWTVFHLLTTGYQGILDTLEYFVWELMYEKWVPWVTNEYFRLEYFIQNVRRLHHDSQDENLCGKWHHGHNYLVWLDFWTSMARPKLRFPQTSLQISCPHMLSACFGTREKSKWMQGLVHQ